MGKRKRGKRRKLGGGAERENEKKMKKGDSKGKDGKLTRENRRVTAP
jgi:hypothetical protein